MKGENIRIISGLTDARPVGRLLVARQAGDGQAVQDRLILELRRLRASIGARGVDATVATQLRLKIRHRAFVHICESGEMIVICQNVFSMSVFAHPHARKHYAENPADIIGTRDIEKSTMYAAIKIYRGRSAVARSRHKSPRRRRDDDRSCKIINFPAENSARRERKFKYTRESNV